MTDSISGNRILDDTLAYDSVGNLLAITDGATGQQQVGNRDLTYDGLDRLTQAYSPMFGSGGLATYTYDVQDNLTGVSIGSRNHAYHYDDGTNRLTSVKDVATGSTVAGLAYDAQGNIANKNGRTFDFDDGNRLRSVVGLESYLYDGHGRRAMSTTAAGRILSHYGFDGRLYYQYDERAKRKVEYFYLGSQLVAQRSRPIPGTAETFEYHHTDALGSSVAVTDSSSTPWLSVRRSKYEPYGALIDRANDDRPGYTGHVMDSTTGLTYMQQRYYDAEIGRFLSVDPVSWTVGGGTHFNRYHYANGNPFKYADSDGRAPHIAAGAFFGGVFGGGAELVKQVRAGKGINWVKVGVETGKGALVGATTAALPGAGAALNLGANATKIVTTVGAVAAGSGGEAAALAATGQPVDGTQVAVAGVANLIGVGAGNALSGTAQKLSTVTTEATPGVAVTSLSGRTFTVGAIPAASDTCAVQAQAMQDVASETAARVAQELATDEYGSQR